MSITDKTKIICDLLNATVDHDVKEVTHIKFKIENGKVYFVSPNGQKNEMTRIQGK